MRKVFVVALLLAACGKAGDKGADVVASAVVDAVAELAGDSTAVDASDAVSAADAPSAVTP